MIRTGMFLLVACLVATRLSAQEMHWYEFESINSDYPLAEVRQGGKTYHYHLKSGVLIDKTENHAADLTVVVKDGRYGVIRDDGLLIVPFEYDAVDLEAEYDGQWYEGISYDYKFAILRKNSFYGIANHDGRVIAPPQYEAIQIISKDIAGVKKDNRWGWIDTHSGEMLQSPIYDEIDDFFSAAHVEINRDGKVGLASKDGTVFIAPEHSGYLRVVSTKNETFIQATKAEIDAGAAEVTTVLYDSLGNVKLTGYNRLGTMYHADFMTFEKDGNIGAVNPHTGQVIIDPVYERIDDGVRGLFKVKKGAFYGVLDSRGNEVVPPVYSELDFINTENQTKGSTIPGIDGGVGRSLPQDEWQVSIRKYRAFIDSQAYFIRVVKDEGMGIFNWEGTEVVPTEKYDNVLLTFHKGAFFFARKKENQDLALLNETGDELAAFPYLLEQAYQYGNSAIENDWDLRNRYVSLQERPGADDLAVKICLYDLENTKMVVPMGDQHINWMYGGFLKVRKWRDNGHTSLYNRDGNLVVTFGDEVSDFFVVSPNHLVLKVDNRYRLVDMEGHTLYENEAWHVGASFGARQFPQYKGEATGVFHHGLMKLYTREGNLFLNAAGKEVRFDAYTDVDEYYTGTALATMEVPDSTRYSGYGYRYGLIDGEGNEIHPMEWEQVSAFSDNIDLLVVTKDEKQGLVNRSGNYLLEPVYDFIESMGSYPNPQIKKDGKLGLITDDGRLLLEPRYDELRRNYEGEEQTWPLLVKEGDWYYFIDKEGKPLAVRAKKYNY